MFKGVQRGWAVEAIPIYAIYLASAENDSERRSRQNEGSLKVVWRSYEVRDMVYPDGEGLWVEMKETL